MRDTVDCLIDSVKLGCVDSKVFSAVPLCNNKLLIFRDLMVGVEDTYSDVNSTVFGHFARAVCEKGVVHHVISFLEDRWPIALDAIEGGEGESGRDV